MSIPYTWSVDAVDLLKNTFTVKYTNSQDNQEVKLNLPLPQTLNQIPAVVARYAPENIWYSVAAPVQSTLSESDILAETGEGVIDPAATGAAAMAATRESFKKQVATALFELGVTPANVYVAPANTVTPATTLPGTAPTVIG